MAVLGFKCSCNLIWKTCKGWTLLGKKRSPRTNKNAPKKSHRPKMLAVFVLSWNDSVSPSAYVRLTKQKRELSFATAKLHRNKKKQVQTSHWSCRVWKQKFPAMFSIKIGPSPVKLSALLEPRAKPISSQPYPSYFYKQNVPLDWFIDENPICLTTDFLKSHKGRQKQKSLHFHSVQITAFGHTKKFRVHDNCLCYFWPNLSEFHAFCPHTALSV